jgi:hypothetical protein
MHRAWQGACQQLIASEAEFLGALRHRNKTPRKHFELINNDY